MTSDVYELTISAPGRNALSSVLMERLRKKVKVDFDDEWPAIFSGAAIRRAT